MVYKKESQVPSNLIRKLNGLAGLFETVDDQFEFIRMQRDIYLDSVRVSKSAPSDFLENELNYDSLVEFMQWRYDEVLDEDEREMVSTLLDVLNEIGILKLKEIELLLVKNEKFIDLATEAYLEICQEEISEDDGFIWEPIKIPVAISANPEWRSKFPWGSFWNNAFIQADKKL